MDKFVRTVHVVLLSATPAKLVRTEKFATPVVVVLARLTVNAEASASVNKVLAALDARETVIAPTPTRSATSNDAWPDVRTTALVKTVKFVRQAAARPAPPMPTVAIRPRFV